ncbi:MAG: hypothetical protein AAF587_30650 [Bacteroidota bacterium]
MKHSSPHPLLLLMSLMLMASCRPSQNISQAETLAQQARYLLLDNRIIHHLDNAELVVGQVQKHPANPLFVEDKNWEVRFDNLYGNIVYDEDNQEYRCWYSPFIVDHSAKGMSKADRDKAYHPPKDREMGICYATSKDGILWEKPELGLVEFEGNKQNNLVWRGPHGAGVFEDEQEQDPAKRFKTIFQGMSVSSSADGIHWAEAEDCEGVDVAGDTHNNAFWSPTLGKYVGITRTWGKTDQGRVRQVARIESEDFKTWTKAEVILQGKGPNDQIYAMPVFFYGNVYLGLVALYHKDSDRVWTELAWSADTKAWNRISPGTPLIPASEEELAYDYGCVYACATPVFLEDEIRLYYGGSDWLHFGWRNGSLCLATLRPDGFAGYEPKTSNAPASITTKLLPYSGKEIQLTADVETGGSIKLSVLNENGQEIASADPVSHSMTEGILTLNRSIQEQAIQLRFELTKARVYSFRLGW